MSTPTPTETAAAVVPTIDHSSDAFSIIERVCSVFSLLGCVFIITTFCFSKAFHKPINRLVFYASFGNLMTNVATLMAKTYILDIDSAGCQFQGFLIQMFMPADAFWTLAMAVNVYLTFYFKFDAQRLRRMEIPYLFCCYGIPFVVALAFIFVSSPSKGRMYGNAALWCWVSTEWDIFRIATFYGPVWIVILITFFIYIRAGREIYKKHKQLRNFSSHHEPETVVHEDPFSSIKTTEVFVTSEAADSNAIDLAPLGRRGSEAASASERKQAQNAAYSVTISSSKRPSGRESYGDISLPIQPNAPSQAPAAPSRPATQANPLRRRAAYEANNAAWSYTKCAILFFTAMLVTWIPSSANRVYSVIHAKDTSLPLEYMSAFVLPLQGFWNAVIYIVTSWKACKTLFSEMLPRPSPKAPERLTGGFRPDHSFQKMSSGGSPRSDKNYESESMTELAVSRPNSHDRIEKTSGSL
ncbi:family A G protein-coupled receptor-like protein [Thozetella sp. PMI_491]|nr:family A G protein-coupled receptor-like protein [Thozetella sp. PMI_491]